MKNFIFYTVFLCFALLSTFALVMDAHAQSSVSSVASAPQVIDNPRCFIVRNMMENSIYGNIATEAFTRDDGLTTRHRANFKLSPMGTKNEETMDPLDIKEFCTTGPFFEGGKISLELKTLFPIFSCLTRIDQGEIRVFNVRDEDGNNKIFAKCFD